MRKIRRTRDCGWKLTSVRQISICTKVSVGSIRNSSKCPDARPDLALTQPAMMANWLPCSIRRPIPPSRPRHVGADWPSVHQELKRRGLPNSCSGRSTPSAIPITVTATPSSVTVTSPGVSCKSAPCARSIRQGKSSLSTTAGPRCPSCRRPRVRSVRHKVFVAVLGASNYTFAEATWSQSLPDWLQSHVRAFEFFGGTPALLIPDNLKSGVSKGLPIRSQLNPSYQQLAEHYQVAVMPARLQAKDKAKAEVGVQIVERWILARLRHQTFFSLAGLNQCIRALLNELNERPFKQLPGNRRDAFEQLDRPALGPLPVHPYRYVAIKTVKVSIDYHVGYEQHHYSVPHQYGSATGAPCRRYPASGLSPATAGREPST